jgi:hypothetical protein
MEIRIHTPTHKNTPPHTPWHTSPAASSILEFLCLRHHPAVPRAVEGGRGSKPQLPQKACFWQHCTTCHYNYCCNLVLGGHNGHKTLQFVRPCELAVLHTISKPSPTSNSWSKLNNCSNITGWMNLGACGLLARIHPAKHPCPTNKEVHADSPSSAHHSQANRENRATHHHLDITCEPTWRSMLTHHHLDITCEPTWRSMLTQQNCLAQQEVAQHCRVGPSRYPGLTQGWPSKMDWITTHAVPSLRWSAPTQCPN